MVVCHQEHLKANTATDFRSAGKFLFLSHLPTGHYTTHYICLQDTHTPPAGEAERQNHSRDRGLGKLEASEQYLPTTSTEGTCGCVRPSRQTPARTGDKPSDALPHLVRQQATTVFSQIRLYMRIIRIYKTQKAGPALVLF